MTISSRGTAHPSGVTKGQYSFAQIPSVQMPRSQFNRSCGLKTSFDSAYLVPVFCDEALPGDTMNLKTALFARMPTLLYPTMDNIFLDMFYFAVPIRLIWDNWQKFNGEQTDPGDSTDYTVPIMTENVADNSLSDYIGIPTGLAGLEFNSLWHRAYNLIWNEWFRDENLQDSVVVDTDDGPDTYTDYVLLKRGKRHDYFTSCLPFTQKGDAVSLPLGTTAPLVGTLDIDPKGGAPSFDLTGATGATLGTVASTTPTHWSAAPSGADATAVWNDPQLEVDLTVTHADLSGASSSTINEIREAFQIQKMLERDARGGSRYTEILRSHFGVISPDQRLQRPEYLGGGSTRINVNPVAVTAAAALKVGDLAAFATTLAGGIGFVKSFTEHCVIIGLANVRADISYDQGLNRMFSRQTRYDFYWPSLAHLGEQAVKNKEIYAQGTAGGTDDDDVFGYQERYAEYRYKPSTQTGTMRTQHATSLSAWHLGLEFGSLPLLNDVFIEDAPPIQRIIAVYGENEILGDFYFNYKCVRPMPTFSVPGLVDHF